MAVDLRFLLMVLVLAALPLSAQEGAPSGAAATLREALEGPSKADKAEPEAPLRDGAFRLKVRRAGRAGWSIDLRGKNARVLDMLAALARETDHRIRAATPGLTAALDETRLDVVRERDNLRDLVRDLVEASGHRFELERKERIFRIRAIPAPDSPDAVEFYRQRGIEALFDAYGATNDKKKKARMNRIAAEFDLAGPTKQDLHAAVVKILEWMDSENANAQNAPDGPELCLRAARIALDARSGEQVWDLYDRFLRLYRLHPLVSRMRIIAAQARMQEGIWIEASRILETVIIDGTRGRVAAREALTAELLFAECQARMGKTDLAIRRLDDIPLRFGQKDSDLRALVPYLRGLCLREKGETGTAMLSFRLSAKMTPDAERRVQALRHEAEIALAAGLPFKAMTAARIAIATKPTGRDAFAIDRILAAAHQQLGLDERALEILEGLAGRIDEVFGDASPDPDLAAELLDDIGELRYRRGEIEDAIILFRALRENQALARRAGYMLALCYHRQERHAEAIRLLDDLILADAEAATRVITGEDGEDTTPVATGDASGEPSPDANPAPRADDELGLRIRALRGDCLVALRLFERAIENYQENG